MTDTDALLATVREATTTLRRAADAERPATADPMYDSARRQADEADAALDSLAAELEERMTRESGQALVEDANRWQKLYWKSQNELERLKAERDEARATALITATAETQKMYREQEARAIQAEARLDKALSALREIGESACELHHGQHRKIARAAIAEIEGS